MTDDTTVTTTSEVEAETPATETVVEVEEETKVEEVKVETPAQA